MANNYLGNFNLLDEEDNVLNQNIAAPPIQKNLSDMSDEELLNEYQKVKVSPQELEQKQQIQSAQRERELYNNLAMIGEKLGRSIGRTTQDVDKDFYNKLTQSGATQAEQQLANIASQQKQREDQFKNLYQLRKEAKERKKDESYLKIQQDQEERSKQRFETDKKQSELELGKATLSHQTELDKNDPNSNLSKTKIASLSTQYPDMKNLFAGKSFNELSILAEGIGGKLKRDDDMYNREQDREVKRQAQELLNFNKQQALEEKQEVRQEKREQKAKLSDKQITDVTSLDNALNAVNDIIVDKSTGPAGVYDTGVLSSAQNKVASWLGIDDAKKSAFKARVGDQLAQYIKAISGAAVSERERAALLENLPTMTDNDATFMEKAKVVRDRLTSNRSNFLKNISTQGKNISEFINNKSSGTGIVYDPKIERGISAFMKANNLSREESISVLKKAGKIQ